MWFLWLKYSDGLLPQNKNRIKIYEDVGQVKAPM